MKKKRMYTNIFFNVIGCFMYAVGINCFNAPHKIAPGGASGIAILLNYIFGMPIGMFVFLFNIPLLLYILYKKYFERSFVIKTLLTTLLLSLITDYVVVRMPVYKGDALLAAMFGGVLMGCGLGFVHLGKSNTGGISLLGLIVQHVKPQFQVGAMISALNLIVVISSVVVFKNIESFLYAVVAVYISGAFMDKILSSADSKDLMIIISECTDKVRNMFLNNHIGITILKGEGGYSSEVQRVILCAIDKGISEEVRQQVKEVDDHALIIITKASKVDGKGFRSVT